MSENLKKSLGNWSSPSRSTMRNHIIAMLGEFFGTFLFLFFAFAPTQIAVTAIKNTPNPTDSTGLVPNIPALLFIAGAFGASLAVNVWTFYRINGGMLNPAVTLGLVLIGAVPPIRGLVVFPAQILGGIAASGVVSALFPGPLLVSVSLGAGTSTVQGLFIEMFLTIQLILVIFMLAVEKHRATFLAPLGIGLSLFICHMTAVYYTGCGVNPTRALGPYVINGSFPSYFWIYWIGPILGAFVAAGIYKVFKLLGYETSNPGQDSGDEMIAFVYRDEESALAAHGGAANLMQFHVKEPSAYGEFPSPPDTGATKHENYDGQLNHKEKRAMNQPIVSVQEVTEVENGPSTG